MNPIATPRPRFENLAALRGFVVLLLAAFHFPAIFAGASSPLLRNAYVSTNMFFALSGFVLMAAYGHKRYDAASAWGLVKARLLRLYPLHLFSLALVLTVPYVAYYTLVFTTALFTGRYAGAMPSFPINWTEVGGDLLLLQGLGFFDSLHLNFPSWSLAALFFCSVIFAVLSLAPTWRTGAFALVGAAAYAVVALKSPHYMDTSYDFGFFRCLACFSLGVLVYELWKRVAASRARAGFDHWATAMQTAAVVGCGAYMVVVGVATPLSMLSPFIFAMALFAFAFDAGDYHRVLKGAWFQWLGDRSFSIFMTHAPLLFLGLQARDWMRHFELGPLASLLAGTVALMGYLALVVMLSDWTYRNIELRFKPTKKEK